MRLQALAFGLVVLVAGGGSWGLREWLRPHSYLLVREVEGMSGLCGTDGNFYFSAWNHGPAIALHDASDGKVVTYRRDYPWIDGCTWEAVEELTPTAMRDVYRYRYDEHEVRCPADHSRLPARRPSSRTGVVRVVRVDGDWKPTPLVATRPGLARADDPDPTAVTYNCVDLDE